MMFRIEMTWTRVSNYLVCACISWFTCCFIFGISLVVDVPFSHFSASAKKGNRLLLDLEFLGGDMFSDPVLSNSTADCMIGL